MADIISNGEGTSPIKRLEGDEVKDQEYVPDEEDMDKEHDEDDKLYERVFGEVDGLKRWLEGHHIRYKRTRKRLERGKDKLRKTEEKAGILQEDLESFRSIKGHKKKVVKKKKLEVINLH